MGDLAQRMDAGVGAPGALDHDGFAGEGGDRLLDRLLDGAAVLLPLPADEGAAVIFDGELVARHRQPRRPSGARRPRRNSAAVTGLLPARCTSVRRTAPAPQATVS